MGCGASQPSSNRAIVRQGPSSPVQVNPPVTHNGAREAAAGPGLVPAHAVDAKELYETKRKQNLHRVSIASKEAAQALFHEFKRNSSLNSSINGTVSPSTAMSTAPQDKVVAQAKMSRDGLRKIVPSIEDELFEYLWKLFDVSNSGAVSADDFMMAMALLYVACETVDDQIEVARVSPLQWINAGMRAHTSVHVTLLAAQNLKILPVALLPSPRT